MAVTVTQGKTHTRYCRLLLGGTDLSGDARALQSVGATHTTGEAQGWNASLKQYFTDQAEVQFGTFEALFSNTAADVGPIEAGSHIAIQAVLGVEDTIATFVIGIREAPTIGAPAFSHQCTPKDYTAPIAGGPITISADFSSASVGQSSTPRRWGQMLAVGTSVSSTTNNGSLDNGASSTAGAIGVLHVTSSAGAMGANDWEVKIQHSANDSTWADLITFTLDGSAVGAEWDDTSATSTVNRYTRVVMTKSAGTDLVAWVNLIRL